MDQGIRAANLAADRCCGEVKRMAVWRSYMDVAARAARDGDLSTAFYILREIGPFSSWKQSVGLIDWRRFGGEPPQKE